MNHEPPEKSSDELLAQSVNAKRLEKIRAQGNAFIKAGAALALAGLVVLFFGVILALGPGALDGWAAVKIGLGLLGAALALYIIGQLVHIRANTESLRR